MTILTRTSYDRSGRSGRSKAVCLQVFDSSTPANGKYWEPVGRYGYNGIGEMTRKTLGCGIQNVDYAHNLRGCMKKMNEPKPSSSE